MTTETIESQAYVLTVDEGEQIENLFVRLLASDARTGTDFTVSVVTNPGPGGPPKHTHATVDEMYFVLKGSYLFQIGDDVTEGGPGTFMFVPRGVPHTFASAGPGEGQLLTFTLPSTEQFVRGISALQQQGMDQQAMADHFRAFDTSVDGPGLM